MHDAWQWSIHIWFQEQVKLILFEVTPTEYSLYDMKQMITRILNISNHVWLYNNSLIAKSFIKQNTLHS